MIIELEKLNKMTDEELVKTFKEFNKQNINGKHIYYDLESREVNLASKRGNSIRSFDERENIQKFLMSYKELATEFCPNVLHIYNAKYCDDGVYF